VITNDDELVTSYLGRLSAAASALPADSRTELIDEITAHIAEARRAGPATSGDSSSVRNILERLGDPADIVRAAADHHASYPASDAATSSELPGLAAGPAPGGHSPGGGYAAPARLGGLEISAVIFLLIGGIVIPFIGWLVGVVLLWVSPRWGRSDKLMGTLVWPGGLLAPIVLLAAGVLAVGVPTSECTTGASSAGTLTSSCTSSSTSTWLIATIAAVLLALAVGGPIFTAIRLLRRAGRGAAVPAQETATLVSA
jgi:hypothetical protein